MFMYKYLTPGVTSEGRHKMFVRIESSSFRTSEIPAVSEGRKHRPVTSKGGKFV